MFNLDQAISNWRKQLIDAGIKSIDVLDELESHLREDVEQRVRGGATEEQGFHEAVLQVGKAGQLQSEFAKLSRPQARLNAKTLRIGCAGVAAFVLLTQGWYLLSSDASLAERIAGLILIAAIALYIGFIPALNRLRPGISGLVWRRAVGKTCAVLVPLWVVVLYLGVANLIHFPSGIFVGAVCWSVFVAAAITGVVLTFGTEPEVLNLWAPGVWQTFTMAQAEAVRFHHDFIGTEHVLLGVLQVEGSPVPKVLDRMGVRPESVRAKIEKIVGSGGLPPSGAQVPRYTPRAQKAFRIAIQEAKTARSQRADTEHLFLGLIREGSGVAAMVLSALGVDAQKARREILEEMANRKNCDE